MTLLLRAPWRRQGEPIGTAFTRWVRTPAFEPSDNSIVREQLTDMEEQILSLEHSRDSLQGQLKEQQAECETVKERERVRVRELQTEICSYRDREKVLYEDIHRLKTPQRLGVLCVECC
mmetsp:Transcript_15596/g.43041  ORF Transcript_15596/g.43041 Transcript_15596/m.43041 type:complete len:119 (-) Transcript_15596:374-730(-)